MVFLIFVSLFFLSGLWSIFCVSELKLWRSDLHLPCRFLFMSSICSIFPIVGCIIISFLLLLLFFSARPNCSSLIMFISLLLSSLLSSSCCLSTSYLSFPLSTKLFVVGGDIIHCSYRML